MKYLSMIIWIFIFILSLFFYQAYLGNHTYYFSMLSSSTNWYIVVFWLLASLIVSWYLFWRNEKSLKWLLFTFLWWFALFSLILWINKWWFYSIWYLIQLVNFIILFVFFSIIILWFLAIWDIILQKLSFKEKIYDFSIKTWLWMWVLWIILFYLTSLWFINTYVSYIALIWLIWLICYRFKNIKNIFIWLNSSLLDFAQDIQEKWIFVKIAFFVIFTLSFYYIFTGLNYSFISYPTAWDANHAYMFIPKVIANYGGYPWWVDFRPALSLWSSFLVWIYNLGSWTRFAQDTWMVVFNFMSAVFVLFFGFMLVNTVVKLIRKKQDYKYDVLLILWYFLILAWLTSWMWAFLVFVDNKTDLAVLMFVILWIFLALYSLFKEKEWLEKKYLYIFLFISWFFFWIANFIKPTATFDFFQTTLLLTILEIWFLTVIWVILFVVWLLAILKFRNFDKAIDPKYGNLLLSIWLSIGVIEPTIKFLKDKSKILKLLVFVWWFIWTLFLTKWFFALVQQINDKNIDTNPKKIVTSLIMWEKISTKSKQEFTWSLYTWLKKDIWSAYNEDNGRYAWYGNKDFWNVWWSFIVPSSFKKTTCIYFDKNLYDKSSCNDKIYFLYKKDKKIDSILNNKAIEIFANKNEDIYKSTILQQIDNAKKNWKLNDLAKQLWVDTTQPEWKIQKEVTKKLFDNTQTQLLKWIKAKLSKWDFDISDYKKIFQTENNKKLLLDLKNKDIIYEDVSIPYKYLVPFNISFNWSLQNLSSYYTDIGIVWLILVFILFFALIYSIISFIKSFISKDKEWTNSAKLLFSFAFVTLVWWTIWYFVASWIVWYDIGGIIWLILTTILYVNRLNDRLILWYVLLFIISVWVFLNLFRIASQWWWQIQTWYRSSAWKQINYKLTQFWLKQEQESVIPYKQENVFNLQFGIYKKAIKAFDNRKMDEAWIIWWTYMKYFIRNQNKIIDDQFLMTLWRLGSDDNIDKFYERLKDQNIKTIVLDPNIASVVMWNWNKSLWYRYYGKTDNNGNLIEKWVFPHFVDLGMNWKLEYGLSNNLWIKYALVIPDNVLEKVTWTKDKKKLLRIRYELTSIKFLPRLVWMNAYQEAIDTFYKILVYRLQNNSIWFAEDLSDLNGYDIDNIPDLLQNWIKNFNNLSLQEKELILQYTNIVNQVKQSKWNPQVVQKVLSWLIQQTLWWRAQFMFVKVK